MMRKIWVLCLWSNISLFSYTDLRIAPQDITTYGVNFAATINLPFVIWNDSYIFKEE